MKIQIAGYIFLGRRIDFRVVRVVMKQLLDAPEQLTAIQAIVWFVPDKTVQSKILGLR
jgi:hypothetical protein